MTDAQEPSLDAYRAFEFTHGRWRRTVYQRGQGPAVIVIHEMPGLHPLVVRFADRVAAAGMSVFLPSLFGVPGKPVSMTYGATELFKGICIRREFSAWAADDRPQVPRRSVRAGGQVRAAAVEPG